MQQLHKTALNNLSFFLFEQFSVKKRGGSTGAIHARISTGIHMWKLQLNIHVSFDELYRQIRLSKKSCGPLTESLKSFEKQGHFLSLRAYPPPLSNNCISDSKSLRDFNKRS